MATEIDALPVLTTPVGNEKFATKNISSAAATALQLRRFTADGGEAQGIFNVVYFGADPTGAADSLPAFNSAIAAAVAAKGGIVYVPPGAYKISDVIKVPSNVHVKGAGRDLSRLVKTAGSTAGGGIGAYATIAMIGATNASVENLGVDHVTNGALVNGIALLRANPAGESGAFCDFCDVINCRVLGFDSHQYLIWSHGATNTRILFNDIDGNVTTYNASSQQEGIEVYGGQNVTVAFNNVRYIGVNGLYLGISPGVAGYSNKHVTAVNNTIQACGTGIRINAAWDATGGLNASQDIHVTGNQISSCHYGHILLRYATTGAPANSVVFKNIYVTDNQIDADVLTNNPFTIQYDMQDKSGNAVVQNVQIVGNQCSGGKSLNTTADPSVAPFQIRYAQGVVVANNHCRNIGAGTDAAFLIHADGSAIADGVQFIGNTVDTCPRSALLVRGVQKCAIHGNRFSNYYTDATGTFSGISLSGTHYTTIEGNRFRHAGTETYAIQFDTSSTELTIGRNFLEYKPALPFYCGNPLQFDQTGSPAPNCSRGRAKVAVGSQSVTISNSLIQQAARLSIYQRAGTPQPFTTALDGGTATITLAAVVSGSDAIFDWEIQQ